MRLDVVVPTYNRAHLLRLALKSLLAAKVPDGLEITLTVVDNNSTDETASVVAELQATATLPLLYVLERKQGSSAARNAGIAAGEGELLGFIDDDEEIHPDWYRTIATEFLDPSLDFIGGPCLASNDVVFPDWLPPGYHSVIGVIPPKVRGFYGPDHPGMLNGGNAVVRRAVLDRIGVFTDTLGRTSTRLLSEEDADLFRRLLTGKFKGLYVPELIIFHHVHKDRLTRSYHRRWAYWRSVSQGVLARDVQEPGIQIWGIPRHRFGRTVRSILALPWHRFAGQGKARAFADELTLWDLVGFIYGRHFFDPQPQSKANRATSLHARIGDES